MAETHHACCRRHCRLLRRRCHRQSAWAPLRAWLRAEGRGEGPERRPAGCKRQHEQAAGNHVVCGQRAVCSCRRCSRTVEMHTARPMAHTGLHIVHASKLPLFGQPFLSALVQLESL